MAISPLGLQTIAVWDSDKFWRRMVANILRSLEVPDVIEIGLDNDPWQDILHTPVNCLVTDWQDGDPVNLDHILKLRETGARNRSVPVLLCTAHTSREEIFAARDAGVTEIVARPVSAEQLIVKLISVTQQPRGFVESDGFIGPDRRRNRNRFAGKDRRGDSGLEQMEIDAMMRVKDRTT